MIPALKTLFVRELKIAHRIGGGAAIGVIFFLILVIVVPFAVGPDLTILARLAPAILWIAALLASLLGMDRLFQADEEDGSLDLLLMSRVPLELVVGVKCIAHWMVTGLPLVVAAPVFGLMLSIEPQSLVGVCASLLVGTPALTFLGAIGAALTTSLRRGGLLMAIVILPFTIPILIFGVATASAATGGAVAFLSGPFLILCALTLASIVIGSFGASTALRNLLH
jgi:heme exporter protein B